MVEAQFFLQHWGVEFREVVTGIQISGSPNRAVKRFLFSGRDGVFAAEGFELRKKSRQCAQNELLELLKAQKMAGINPWCRTLERAHGAVADGCFWQLRRWCAADGLPRETLGEERVYSTIWTETLRQLQKFAPPEKNPRFMPNEDFYFSGYLPRLARFAAEKGGSFAPGIAKLLTVMRPICRELDKLPQMFAHGDFHPGNILVHENRLSAVIDWEFCGWKPAGYDLALLLGCLGMDNLRWLSEGATVEMQNALYRQNYMPEKAWEMLPFSIAAVRLGWLGEWLDLGDQEMIKRELEFISFLL